MFPFCNKIIIIVGALSLPSVASGVFDKVRPSGECLRPGGVRGICKNINDCEPLRNLLIKSKSRPRPWVIDFLKKSHCGFEGKDPVVCCILPPKPKEIDLKLNSTIKNPFAERFSNKSCGSIQVLDKVIGGSATGRHEFPWMALIGYKTRFGVQFRCGGSLINSRYVLTAAHCVTTLKEIYPTLVRLGEYDFGSLKSCDGNKDCGSSAKDVPIDALIPHPEYYKAELRNDIALIRLAKSVEFKEFIRPVCLPLDKEFRERSLENDKAVVAGWGTTESGTNTEVLRKVTLPIIPLSECSKIYKRKIPITQSQICAGGEAGKDSCSGDSGGPLQILGLNPSGEPAYIQHGIVSFGPRICGTKGMPGVYTRVAHYVDWILKNVKE